MLDWRFSFMLWSGSFMAIKESKVWTARKRWRIGIWVWALLFRTTTLMPSASRTVLLERDNPIQRGACFRPSLSSNPLGTYCEQQSKPKKQINLALSFRLPCTNRKNLQQRILLCLWSAHHDGYREILVCHSEKQWLKQKRSNNIKI